MARLRMKLLGSFRLSCGNVQVSIPHRKACALLAYLGAHPEHGCPRMELATLLWGEADEQRALLNFRQCLFQLRRRTDELARAPLLRSDGDRVCLDVARVDIDLLRLRALAASSDPCTFSELLPLVSGDLLSGLHVADEYFEEWLAEQRLQIQDQRRRLLARCVQAALHDGATSDAIDAASQLAHLDPFDEESQRVLLRTFVAAGEKQSALQHYRHLAEVFHKELAVDPDAETTAIVSSIAGGGTRCLDRERAAADSSATTRRNVASSSLHAHAREPSIAVLPFDNWSSEPGNTFRALNFSMDLINALSRFQRLFVVSRNSSFSYAWKFVPNRQVVSELGVRYALSGSLRDAGANLRMTFDLVDAIDDRSIWFDDVTVPRDDVNALCSDLSENLVAKIFSEIQASEWNRAWRTPLEGLDAWSHFHRGLWHYSRHRQKAYEQAKACFARAIELEPAFSQALVGLANVNIAQIRHLHTDTPEQLLREAEDAAERARALNGRDAWMLETTARLRCLRSHYPEAIALAHAAVKLNPNWSGAHFALGNILYAAGQPRDAIAALEIAARLDPASPDLRTLYGVRARAHLAVGDLKAALCWARHGLQQRQSGAPTPLTTLISVLSRLGRINESQRRMDRFMQGRPRFTVTRLRDSHRHMANAEQREILLKGLLRAGAPP